MSLQTTILILLILIVRINFCPIIDRVRFGVLMLVNNHRQGEDGTYANILNRIRGSDMTDKDIDVQGLNQSVTLKFLKMLYLCPVLMLK